MNLKIEMSYSLLSVELCSGLFFTEATTKKKEEGNSKHLYKCLKAKVEANQLGVNVRGLEYFYQQSYDNS